MLIPTVCSFHSSYNQMRTYGIFNNNNNNNNSNTDFANNRLSSTNNDKSKSRRAQSQQTDHVRNYETPLSKIYHTYKVKQKNRMRKEVAAVIASTLYKKSRDIFESFNSSPPLFSRTGTLMMADQRASFFFGPTNVDDINNQTTIKMDERAELISDYSGLYHDCDSVFTFDFTLFDNFFINSAPDFTQIGLPSEEDFCSNHQPGDHLCEPTTACGTQSNNSQLTRPKNLFLDELVNIKDETHVADILKLAQCNNDSYHTSDNYTLGIKDAQYLNTFHNSFTDFSTSPRSFGDSGSRFLHLDKLNYPKSRLASLTSSCSDSDFLLDQKKGVVLGEGIVIYEKRTAL